MPEDFRNLKVDAPGEGDKTITLEDVNYNIDLNGNAIDDKGEIFKTKDEIANLNEPTPEIEKKDKPDDFGKVTIDEVELNLDKDGNALNEDGSVKHTKDELSKLEEEDKGEVINVDDKDYKLDKDGNAVDDEGIVVHTKEDLDKMSEPPVDVPDVFDIPTLIKDTGLELTDEEGNAVEYTNDVDGLKTLLNDVQIKAERESGVSAVTELFETYPIVRRLVKHLDLNSGSAEGFDQVVDFSKVELNKDNEKQLEQVSNQYFLAKGHTPEEAERLTNFSKADKTLFDDTEKRLDFLQKSQEAGEAEQDRVLQEQRNTDAAKQEQDRGFILEKGKMVDLKHDGSIYDKVMNKGELTLNGTTYQIPKTLRIEQEKGKTKVVDRAELINYMYIPKNQVVEGQKVIWTDHQVAMYYKNKSRTIDEDILDVLNVFTGNGLSQMVEQKVSTDKVDKVRKLRSSSYKTRSKIDKGGTGDSKKVVLPPHLRK